MNRTNRWGRALLLAVLTVMSIASAAGDVPDDIRKDKEAAASAANSGDPDFVAGKALLAKLKIQAKQRRMVLDRTYVFPRSQTKYSGRLYQNCYKWHIRPLFANRELWDDTPSDHKSISFRKTFELYRLCGVDGYATFVWPGANEFDRTFRRLYEAAAADKLDPKSFHLLFEVTSSDNYADIDDRKLKMIAEDPYTFRVNGKSLISSYVMDNWSPEQIDKYLRKWKEKVGDKIAFIPQLHLLGLKDPAGNRTQILALADIYRQKGALSASQLKLLMEYLRSYARVCDGIYLTSPGSQPDLTVDDGFYREVICPVFAAVLAEPEFNGRKIFAMAAATGYTGYHGGQTKSREGTATLRKHFELIREFKPDVVICPEWDELNEDTGFQPHVHNPMSSLRILRYYMALLKGQAPTPVPGDDTAIPNLIVSQRRQLSLGEKFELEILMVPDTNRSEPCRIRLEVIDELGKVVYKTPQYSFDTAVLHAETLTLPSEKFPKELVLRPRLHIDYRNRTEVIDTGLPFTVLRPTNAWDQTYSSTSLRNLLRPLQADIRFTPAGNGSLPGTKLVDAKAAVTFAEKLSIAEVVQDSLELMAWDPADEYLLNSGDRRLIELNHSFINNPSRIAIAYTAAIQNAPSALSIVEPERSDRKATALPLEGNQIRFSGNSDWYVKSKFISVKASELDKAVLTITGKRYVGAKPGEAFSWTLPLKELGDSGIVSKAFDDGLTFTAAIQYRPVREPLPLKSTGAAFSRRIIADNPSGILALRAVSESGKVFWSDPTPLNLKPSGPSVPVYVFSSTTRRGVKLEIAADRVPDIRYRLDPTYGQTLSTSAGREYYAQLGGYVSLAINFTGGESASFAMPFRMFKSDIFPGADRPVPQWEKLADGKWGIRFDGERGNFLTLPKAAMPNQAGYTLSFEIRPDTVKDMILFRHGGHSYGGLIFGVRNGCYYAAFVGRDMAPGQPFYFYKHFQTSLKMEKDRWQKVCVAYNQQNLRIDVDGRSETFPLSAVGIYYAGQSNFGGFGDLNKDGSKPFFKGLLKSLEIRHSVSDRL